MANMKELLTHELGDLLYAEQLILKMLGTLTREVNNPEMLARVQEHIGETEEQIERLKRAFAAIGEKAKAEKCQAAIGLKEEHDSFKKEEKPSKQMLEAFDLGNSLRVEHYEIAGYRSAIAVATAMGNREVAGLLGESLREEEAMATFIERNSVKALKMLGTGMDLVSGAADVQFTAESPSRSRGASKSASKTASKSAGGSRSNGRAADSGSSSSKGGSGKSSTASKSASKSTGKTASKSASKSASSSRSSGGSSRTTSERSSGSRSSSGGSSSKSGGSKSGGSKSGGSKSGGSKSGGGSRSRSGSSARA